MRDMWRELEGERCSRAGWAYMTCALKPKAPAKRAPRVQLGDGQAGGRSGGRLPQHQWGLTRRGVVAQASMGQPPGRAFSTGCSHVVRPVAHGAGGSWLSPWVLPGLGAGFVLPW